MAIKKCVTLFRIINFYSQFFKTLLTILDNSIFYEKIIIFLNIYQCLLSIVNTNCFLLKKDTNEIKRESLLINFQTLQNGDEWFSPSLNVQRIAMPNSIPPLVVIFLTIFWQRRREHFAIKFALLNSFGHTCASKDAIFGI